VVPEKRTKIPQLFGKIMNGELGHPRPLSRLMRRRTERQRSNRSGSRMCFQYKLKCSLLEMYCNRIRLHVNRNVMECAKLHFIDVRKHGLLCPQVANSKQHLLLSWEVKLQSTSYTMIPTYSNDNIVKLNNDEPIHPITYLLLDVTCRFPKNPSE